MCNIVLFNHKSNIYFPLLFFSAIKFWVQRGNKTYFSIFTHLLWSVYIHFIASLSAAVYAGIKHIPINWNSEGQGRQTDIQGPRYKRRSSWESLTPKNGKVYKTQVELSHFKIIIIRVKSLFIDVCEFIHPEIIFSNIII